MSPVAAAGVVGSRASLMASKDQLPLVVCVDDDPAVLATVVRCLERVPVEVRSTLSPSQALAWIAAEEVAVLLSDYEMPEMTGAELAAQAREIRPETVRILLTGKRSFETAIAAINRGEILRFLSKPFDSALLRAAVTTAVARNRELLAMSRDHQHRKRREGLRAALEVEYPRISTVQRRGDVYEVTADPWRDAISLGLPGLCAELETS